MSYISKLDKGLKYLNEPRLIKLKKRGFNIDNYLLFKTPFFQGLNINTILDIGANNGQAAITFSESFPNAIIYSFEPIPKCFGVLKDVTKGIPSIQAFNFALGSSEGNIEFNENEFSASSSLLNVANTHIENFPFTANVKKTIVKIKRLDDFKDEIVIKNNVMLKIDVQGFEDKVIEGGIKILAISKLVIIETSMKELYENQPLFDDIYKKLTNLGFVYYGSLEQLYSPITREILQQDSIFIKK